MCIRDRDRGDERQSGHQEGSGPLGQAAEVEEGDHGEHGQAEGEGVGRERAECGGQRAHPGSDRDRDGEDVVHDQRGSRQQRQARSEIGPGDRIGACLLYTSRCV